MDKDTIPNEILEKANEIIYKAKRDYTFLADNGKLTAMQGREVDGAYYEIEIDENYILEIKTEDFSISKYTVIKR
jgi:hypothetical protein